MTTLSSITSIISGQTRQDAVVNGNEHGLELTAEERRTIDHARSVKQWYMVVAEDGGMFSRGDRITGQFTPQQMVQNIGANIVEGGGYGRNSPIIQWIGGKLREISFQARLFSHHSQDTTAEQKLQDLEWLTVVHPNLGRPPIVNFFWGVAIPNGMPCFVDTLGGISYDEIRDDGTIRGVTLNITLKAWTQFRFIQSTASRPDVAPGESGDRTPAHIARDGETYEMIAGRVYGDPMMGVPLRRLNPRFPMDRAAPSGIADLSSGDRVKLYRPQELTKEGFKPRCHVLDQENYIAADNRRRYFALRSKVIAVLPRR